jgi:ubiquinone/menaquinone biosynthesis C-methylase UbiE
VNFKAGSRILDAGCGFGVTARYLSQSLRLETVGVDCSEEMLAVARRSSGNIPLICSELESLSFVAASFDAVICECVLSQTRSMEVLAEFNRVLCVNGHLLISDLYLKSAMPNRGPDKEIDHCPATREQMQTMLEQTGFTVEHWEDRTRELQLLAAQLIMASGSIDENLPEGRKPGCDLNKALGGMDARNTGYYLLVARRTV